MIMKTNFWKSAVALFMGLAAVVACQPEDNTPKVEPVFPTEIYENLAVEAGATESFTITPNMDWEVSVPVENLQWFWLVKEGEDQKYDKISGIATEEPIEILVAVNETEEFNENRTVEVTLTMDGQSKVVAKLMRPAKERTLSVYAATLDEWGFVPSENTEEQYKYTENAVSSITLAWPEDKDRFMAPIKVVANYDWSMNYPDWVEYVVTSGTYGKAGVVEMRFAGIPSKYPIAGETGKLAIKAADDDSNVQEFDLVIPACNDRIEFGLWTSVASPLTFNAAGQYNSSFMGYQEGPAGAYIKATKEARIIAVEWNNSWEAYDTKEASWITMNLSAWNTAEGADVIQERDVEISVSANDSENARKAVLFFLPESVTASLLELFNDQGTEILDQYKKYVLELNQEGKELASGDYITLKQSEYGTIAENGGEFCKATETWLPGMFNASADNCYRLTYSKEWTRDAAFMEFASPYTSYEIYNTDGNRVSADALESFWLSFMELGEDKKMGVIDMRADVFTEGFVKFLGSEGETLAVVYCIFDPTFNPSGEGGESSGKVEFIGEMAMYAEMVGASLAEVTSGEYYDTYKEYGCPIYSLTYASFMAKTMPMSVSVPNYLMVTVNPASLSDYFWAEGTEGGATIYMQMPEGQDEAPTTATMLFYGADYSVVFVLVCNWAPAM